MYVVPMPAKTIQTLCETLGFAKGHGYHTTHLPEVTVSRGATHEAACPLLYQGGLGFVLQGYKLGAVGGHQFTTGGDHYLILSNNLPIRCETLATGSEPVLGIHVAIAPLELQRLVTALREDPEWNRQTTAPLERVVVAAHLNGEIRSAVQSLIEILHDPVECHALGSSALTNLYFQVLRSDDGRVLESLTRSDSKLSKVSAAMRYMEQHLPEKISMDELASVANMSRSAFHRAFKTAVGESPLQYLKQMRLNTARNLITYDGQSANLAAQQVGYESANQFSREFKRYFGMPPSKARELPYADLTGVSS